MQYRRGDRYCTIFANLYRCENSMFFLPYNEYKYREEYVPSSKKEKVENFIELLIKAGFPENQIERNDRGIKIDTKGTVLSKKDDFLSSNVHTDLCYGTLILASTNEKTTPWESYLIMNISEKNISLLPKELMLDQKAEAEELEVVERCRLIFLESLNKYPQKEEKRKSFLKALLAQEWTKQGYSEHHLQFKLERTLSKLAEKAINTMTSIRKMQTQIRTSVVTEKYHQLHAEKIQQTKDELIKLTKNVLNIGDHNVNTGNKYFLLRQLSNKIENADFKSVEAIRRLSKTFIMLSLQRNMIGFTNTTTSGDRIHGLLNTEEYKNLRQTLFSSEAPIRYRDLRTLTCGANNERFFSSLYKNQMYQFFQTNMDRLLKEDNVEHYSPEMVCCFF